MWIIAAPAGAMAGCVSLGGATLCDGDVSHTEVGRQVIFPHGPAGERVGDFVVRPKATLPQVPRRATQAARPGPRPLNRPDRLTDPRHGEDFGAFAFPSGPPPAGLTPSGPLR